MLCLRSWASRSPRFCELRQRGSGRIDAPGDRRRGGESLGHHGARVDAHAVARAEEARQVLSTGIAAADRKGDQHARSEMETLLAEIS